MEVLYEIRVFPLGLVVLRSYLGGDYVVSTLFVQQRKRNEIGNA
jgi:hypothetical protein